MAHMRRWASPVTLENTDDIGCDLLEQKSRDGRNLLSFRSEEKRLCHF